MNHKILSVGGSIIIPKTGFNIPFLKQFRAMILARIKRGDQFVLVIGGGGTARAYQEAAKGVHTLTNEDLDWIGIQSTILNAQFVRYMFKEYAHPEVITNPKQKVSTKKPIIVAAGYKPGHSTDMDAVLLAEAYKVKEIINLSNIAYVYTKDPNVYPDAKKIEHMNWKAFRGDIVGDIWKPGANMPFDPVASKKAEKLKLTVSFLQGTNLKEVEKALIGKKFDGTVITP